MTCLPDVNVWVALAVAEHIHHRAAQQWFDQHKGSVTFCRITQMGFLRILTNRHALGPDTLSPAHAWSAFDAFFSDSRIAFSYEPPGLEHHWRAETIPQQTGSNWWTDAYLASFAAVCGFTLVTFDAQLARRDRVSAHLLKR